MKNILFFAHRGGGHGIYENRLATIKKTLQNPRVDAVEVDIRLTKDGVLVVHHDRGVYINGKRFWIDKLKYNEIKHFDIPTFVEVLRLFKGSGKAINIDIKDERCANSLAVIIKRNNFKVPMYIDCFNLETLLELQEYIPEAVYCLSHNPKDSFDFNRRFVFRILTLLITIFFTQFVVYFLKKKFRRVTIDGISVHAKFATVGFVNDLKAFGFKIFVYGVDSKQEFYRTSKLNIDGIKTEQPSVFY